uniref:SAM domain-containing protein n=1 Tax=Attheya septentrionalis TaxID=420275 RepID=A0A7S2UKF3_9STRA|mmetsp:Transcript_27336/g.49658  ORF Transcript_27336/g.49658 Transcript_27336/m.49658 type:complete len:235 (+) Transcript_27336:64-768(+)
MALQDEYILQEGETKSTRFEGYETWGPLELAAHFKENGLGDYQELLVHHKITGKLAPLLKDVDLRDMGITCVGDRLRFQQLIANMKRKARATTRSHTVWVGEERIYFSDIEKCFLTCAGVCPDDPSTYKLTSNHLKLKTVKPFRIGPIKMCCCHEYTINNIDLTNVTDVDVIGVPAPCLLRACCCAKGKDILELQTAKALLNGKMVLTLKGGEGDGVSEIIMNQVEESQVMERD